MDTQYGAPVITACQCVCNTVGFGVFLGSHIKSVVATVSASRACNRRKLSGASESPRESPRCIQAADDTCRGVTRCPHERATDTMRGARLQLFALSVLQGTRVCPVHFDKLTVAFSMYDLQCGVLVCDSECLNCKRKGAFGKNLTRAKIDGFKIT